MNTFEFEGAKAYLVIGEHKVLIDAEDVPRVKAFNWFIGHRKYVKAHIGFGRERFEIKLHRLIMSFPDGIIDHANLNPLDNRKANLRMATKAQNRANSLKTSKTVSKYRGVYPRKDSPGKFRASITVNGEVTPLGTFDCPIAAGDAYDDAAFKAFGEFATLNLFL